MSAFLRTLGAGLIAASALVVHARAQETDGDFHPQGPVLLPTAWLPGQLGLAGWPPRPDAVPPPGSGVTAPLARDDFRVRYLLHHETAEDLRRGSHGSTYEIVADAGFALAPIESTRDRHEFLAEYGLGTGLAVHLMLPFLGNELVQRDSAGERSSDRTSGLGDVEVGARLELDDEEDERWAIGAAVSIPTGSTSQNRDQGPGPDGRLPYQLQLGSGTVDLRPEILWSRWTRRWSYGARAGATLRTGRGDEGYTLGDRVEVTAWVARRIDRDHSLSLRLEASRQGGIDGADPALDPLSSPASSPGSSGIARIDAFLGVQYVGVAGHRFSAEVGGPLLQHADGFQVDTDLVGFLSWSYSF